MHICLATVTVPAQLIIRETTTGHPVAWPLLVARCPFTGWRPHYHIHPLLDPGVAQLKIAPCSRRPYMLRVGA